MRFLIGLKGLVLTPLYREFAGQLIRWYLFETSLKL